MMTQQPAQVSPQRAPRASAAPICFGLGSLILAGALSAIAQQIQLNTVLNLQDYTGDNSAVTALTVLGGILAFIGLALLLVGIYRLASNMDRIAGVQKRLPTPPTSFNPSTMPPPQGHWQTMPPPTVQQQQPPQGPQ